MAIGNFVVYACFALTLIGIVMSILRLLTKENQFTRYSRITTAVLFFLITLTMFYLYYLFLKSDLTVEYVWQYSSVSHPLIYKISGVLAGMAGSLLFWIWMAIIPWAYEELKATRYPKDEDLMDWTRIALFGILGVLLLILSLHSLFDPTSSQDFSIYPDGQGLNPMLQTELMVIHPPIVFIAYGFLALPLAAGMAHLITGNKKWVDLSINWSRAAWLFLTLGIGIGALWAYVVLGWGGYWAWDPVETSSLLPWLLLTGFLHAQLMHKRKGDYPLLAPVMGVLTFILVIFATFTTRAGGLWVSVHTFGEADTQIGPWQRLMDILSESQTVRIYFVTIIAGLVIITILALWRYSKIRTDKEEKYYTVAELISDDLLMLATVFLFIVITLVTLVILIIGVNGLTAENFDTPVGALAIIGIVVLMLCLLWRYAGRKWIAIIALALLCFSGSYYLLGTYYLHWPVEATIIGATTPILVVALIGTGYKVYKSFNPKRAWRSMRVVSAHLIHLSVVFIVIGYVGSNYLAVEESITLTVDVDGAGEEFAGYTLKAVSIEPLPESVFVDIEVWKDNSLVGRARPGLVLIDGQVRNEIKVVDTWSEDLYITYDSAALVGMDVEVSLIVKVLPLMKFLWGGMWLMAIGIILRVAAEKTTGRRKDREKIGDEDADEDSDEVIRSTEVDEGTKDDKYYEDLIEEELRKFSL